MLAIDPKDFPLVLRSIYVRSSSTSMKDTFDPFTPNQHLTARFRTQKPSVLAKPTDEADASVATQTVCTFLIRFEFAYALAEQGAPVDDDSALVAEIKATLAIDYFVHGEMPSDAELDRWGQTSALIHSWPYWREFCHGALTRMSLPVVLMPMLDVQAIMNKTSPEATKKRAAPKKAKK